MGQYVEISIYRFDVDISYRIFSSNWLLKFSIYRDIDLFGAILCMLGGVHLLLVLKSQTSGSDQYNHEIRRQPDIKRRPTLFLLSQL